MRPEDIKAHVERYYSRFYQEARPDGLPIKTGKALALSLGYPVEALGFVPDHHWDKFLPCGNPLPYLRPSAGDRILNLGCGASMDSFALATTGAAPVDIIGMDVVHEVMVEAMRLSLHQQFRAGTFLRWVRGDGEHLPFRDETFQWVAMNGVLNLFPDKQKLLGEIYRVLGPCGRIVCTDLCCDGPLPDYFLDEADSWAWCMSGACTEMDLSALIEGAFFDLVRVVKEEEPDLLYRITLVCRKRRISAQKQGSGQRYG